MRPTYLSRRRKHTGLWVAVACVLCAAVLLALWRDVSVSERSPDGALVAQFTAPTALRLMADGFSPSTGSEPSAKLRLIDTSDGRSLLLWEKPCGLVSEHPDPLLLLWSPHGDRLVFAYEDYNPSCAFSMCYAIGRRPPSAHDAEPGRWVADLYLRELRSLSDVRRARVRAALVRLGGADWLALACRLPSGVSIQEWYLNASSQAWDLPTSDYGIFPARSDTRVQPPHVTSDGPFVRARLGWNDTGLYLSVVIRSNGGTAQGTRLGSASSGSVSLTITPPLRGGDSGLGPDALTVRISQTTSTPAVLIGRSPQSMHHAPWVHCSVLHPPPDPAAIPPGTRSTVYSLLLPWKDVGYGTAPRQGTILGFGVVIDQSDATGRKRIWWMDDGSGVAGLGHLLLTD